MILKILLFARDKPFFFFPVAMFLAFSVVVVLLSMVTPLANFAQNQMNLSEDAESFIEKILFFPFFLLFVVIFCMLIEFWFNLFGIAWMFGLKEKPFTNALIDIFSKNHKRR